MNNVYAFSYECLVASYLCDMININFYQGVLIFQVIVYDKL